MQLGLHLTSAVESRTLLQIWYDWELQTALIALQVRPLFAVFIKVLNSTDDDVVADAAWGLSYLSEYLEDLLEKLDFSRIKELLQYYPFPFYLRGSHVLLGQQIKLLQRQHFELWEIC